MPKPKSNTKKTPLSFVTVQMDASLKAGLQHQARLETVSVSAVVRRALLAYMKDVTAA